MTLKKLLVLVGLLIVTAVILAACGGAALPVRDQGSGRVCPQSKICCPGFDRLDRNPRRRCDQVRSPIVVQINAIKIAGIVRCPLFLLKF